MGTGLAAYSIGTVECITPTFFSAIRNNTLLHANLATYPHVVDGFYTTVAFNMTGGSLLRWYRDTFGQLEKAQAQEFRMRKTITYRYRLVSVAGLEVFDSSNRHEIYSF